jgi:hypothetical protein
LSKISQLPVYWHACSQLVNRSLKRKAIGWFKHTGSWSIFQQMNWSALSNELIRYFINTSIATTVIGPTKSVCVGIVSFLANAWGDFKVLREGILKFWGGDFEVLRACLILLSWG